MIIFNLDYLKIGIGIFKIMILIKILSLKFNNLFFKVDLKMLFIMVNGNILEYKLVKAILYGVIAMFYSMIRFFGLV